MTARTTMADLITELRGMTEAGTAEWTLGTVTYWSDDQLQAILDRNRQDIYNEPLTVIQRHTGGGSVEYHDYYSAYKYLEATDGGTAVFWIEDAAGVDVGTANYTPDYMTGRVTFPTDTAGSALYLTGRSYNLNSAAAEVWNKKAAHYAATSFDFSTDNMRVNRSQVVKHCREMAAHYAAQAGPQVGYFYRSDIDAGALE